MTKPITPTEACRSNGTFTKSEPGGFIGCPIPPQATLMTVRASVVEVYGAFTRRWREAGLDLADYA